MNKLIQNLFILKPITFFKNTSRHNKM